VIKARALIVTKNNQLVQQLEQILGELGIEFHIREEWKRSFVEQRPYNCYLMDSMAIDKAETMQIPSAAYLIGLIHDPSFDEMRRWMKRGAHDVIIFPAEIEMLRGLLTDIQEEIKTNEARLIQEQRSGGGNVFAFYSTKGGSGKTLLSTIMAQCLQVQFEKRVMLIDLNAQFGGLETVMGLEPKRSYYDLQPVLKELTISHVLNVAIKDEVTGLHILPGPATPEKAEHLNEELITRVIRTCRAHFDYVLLDLPSALNTVSFTGLNEATDIYYVLTPDSLALRGLKRANTLFQRYHLGNRDNLSIIINRSHAKAELTEKDISRIVGIPIAGNVRSDFFSIQPLLNMGRPFIRKKKEKGDKVVRDIRQILEKTGKVR
jgi:pilus assembly protein CpaE